ADGANTHNTSASIATNAGVITDAAGASTRSASANMWTNGAHDKYWQVKINATGHFNLKLSSQQRSSGTGPRDFAIQFRVGMAGNWTDIPGGTLILTNDFAEGVFTDLSIPSNADNQTEVFIRWLMTSNTSVNEDLVSNAGTSRIDNIYVRGNGTIAVEFVPGYENRSVSDTSIQVTGLEPTKNYYYRVRAGFNGSVSGASNMIQLTTPPLVPLPVQMINVKATRVGKGVLVTWSNPSESSILYYDVERSLSGATFKPFARKLPAHNRGDLAAYELLDTVIAPQRFYRISAVEASGQESRSIVVGWKETKESQLEVYPNPVRGQAVSLTMSNAPAGSYQFFLHNSSGQMLHSFKMEHRSEVITKEISLPKLRPGIHLLQLTGPVQLKKWIVIQ
ncbi:MAG TPA: T9SS type A sorting domain-containing protein, partial [Flavisolibacter sp.]